MKTLIKRYRGARIVEADPRWPFMTVQFFPKTEEERKAILEMSATNMAILGTAVGPSLLLGALK